jgi:hypothetical protein
LWPVPCANIVLQLLASSRASILTDVAVPLDNSPEEHRLFLRHGPRVPQQAPAIPVLSSSLVNCADVILLGALLIGPLCAQVVHLENKNNVTRPLALSAPSPFLKIYLANFLTGQFSRQEYPPSSHCHAAMLTGLASVFMGSRQSTTHKGRKLST